MTPTARPRIALVVAPETSASVLFGCYDALSTVGPMRPDMIAAETGEPLLDVQIVAATKASLRVFGEIPVEPHAGVDELDAVDAVVVCDMDTPIGTPPRATYAAETAWISRDARAPRPWTTWATSWATRTPGSSGGCSSGPRASPPAAYRRRFAPSVDRTEALG